MSKKIQVSFSDGQLSLIRKLRGEFGETDSEVIRGIVVSWLAEKGLISSVASKRIHDEQEESTRTAGKRK